ncbi:TPA: helix-turn-helix transcriptional regulator [Streptococcus suis]|uniref:helix-turn-helix domain-containing protein n=1 Tax=Streptococcus suis TaxID=1307 RepID=UPI0005CE1091|nr:helix-turn-helix transcriptional regulator [Streptococcus suis]NQR13680.1 helix-turn-helix transcriptional regulator [Streptococcus suis]CYU94899.1 transcriptional regulator [Streptococcus suis]HEM4389141.1 helix-turn-helix transcriptional regulator [Streptococcus suis]HEM4610710.1 helix-turn-helix transcriptional regulator [Streptococcus suis]HEM5643757.1 helix-turn-helix transcriptional regulator [Streptococcus suis]
MNNNVQVGERIKQIRLSLGESMEKFGERFETSKGTVNNWEKGRNLPNKENLKKIADLQNKSVGELLYGDYTDRILGELKNVSWFYDFEETDLHELAQKVNDSIINKYGYFPDFLLPNVDISGFISFALDNLLTNKKMFEISPESYYKINSIPTYYIENEDPVNNSFTLSSFTNLEIIFNDFETEEDLDKIQLKYSTLLEIDYIIIDDYLEKITFEGLEKIERPQYNIFFNADIINKFKKSISKQVFEFAKKDHALMLERLKN